jgi:hypothetical protein
MDERAALFPQVGVRAEGSLTRDVRGDKALQRLAQPMICNEPVSAAQLHSRCMLRRADCRQKTLNLLLQAVGLFSEFAGRTEDQFGSGSDLA